MYVHIPTVYSKYQAVNCPGKLFIYIWLIMKEGNPWNDKKFKYFLFLYGRFYLRDILIQEFFKFTCLVLVFF